MDAALLTPAMPGARVIPRTRQIRACTANALSFHLGYWPMNVAADWVMDTGRRHPMRGGWRHPFPTHSYLLAMATKRPLLVPVDVINEGRNRSRVRRHGMIREVPAYHLPEPTPLLGHRHMEHAIQRLLDLDESGSVLHHGFRRRQLASFCVHRHDDVLSCPQRMFAPGTYRCSSPLPHKHSPPDLEPLKRPAFGRFC